MNKAKRDKLKANVGTVFDMAIAPTVLELIADIEILEDCLRWIPVEERLPENGKPVLAYTDWGEGGRRIRAKYIYPKTIEATSEDMDTCQEYDEATDNYYLQEGWYEENCFEETNWRVDGKVSHWMELPPKPERKDRQ